MFVLYFCIYNYEKSALSWLFGDNKDHHLRLQGQDKTLKAAKFFKSRAISFRLLKKRNVVKIFNFLFPQISWEPDFEPYLVLPTELVPKYVSFFIHKHERSLRSRQIFIFTKLSIQSNMCATTTFGTQVWLYWQFFWFF